MKMKRRVFGLLAGTSLAALKIGQAKAQTAPDPSLLGTKLTPFGSQPEASADGSIPAWTGGYTTLPPGWQTGQAMPDFFGSDQPVAVINAANMAQYADRLTDGVKAMMTQYGFSIKVYPSRRTQSVPQSVADNIAKNVLRAKLVDPSNPQNGFTGAFGGIPFPIPDTSNPLAAGAQIIYNHQNRWGGFAQELNTYGYVVSDGQLVLSDRADALYDHPYYYRPDLPTMQIRQFVTFNAPAELIGEQLVDINYTDNTPQQAWELLNGQGRVRKAPEVSFDTPSGFANGVAGNDEYYGFYGQQIKYDWKYIEKKEMYIPYNNNAMFLLPAEQVLIGHFPDPDIVRWELHRVWVVEATLHPGERNVLARRKFYVDEDTWTIGLADGWDQNQNLYKVNIVYNYLRPDMPGLLQGNNGVFNLQTGDYALIGGPWNEKAHPSVKFSAGAADAHFDPENMAAQAQY